MPTSTRHILPNHVLGGERGILPSVIISGFVKAEIVDVPMPEDEETPLAASTDDLPLSLTALFHIDSESSDFKTDQKITKRHIIITYWNAIPKMPQTINDRQKTDPCKITRALVIITYWNIITTKRAQTINNPPKTDPKCWNWCSLKKNWGIQRVPKDWTSTKQIAIKGTCKLNTVQYLNSHFFKIDIKTSSTTSCILLINKLFIFN